MALPTLVFVPGSWHRPTCYSKIIKLLQEQHHIRCVSVVLASTSGDPNATFKEDIDAARTAIADETAQGRDVVVVAHSYGGMVGNSAIKGFTRPKDGVPTTATSTASQRTDQSASSATTGYVVGLILIASGFTLTGLSFMDPLFGIPPPSWRVNKESGFAELVTPPRELFYHDVPADEAEYWVSQLTPQSLKALFDGGEHAYAGWKNVPVWYIGTIEDHGLPVVIQRVQVGMARGMGGDVEHRELRSSHSPFLSQPDEVVEIMMDAIAAFTGTLVKVQSVTRFRRHEITVPAANVWQPLSWFRFGLPLVFGHTIGGTIFVIGWFRGLWRSGSR
ncbi:Alpha/beta hydrolase family-domain-containing protein [Lophiotrema nucula]|uniref:Alpha/beta hydrolase family-domain-containing protein n=1 Tax=Lophiotrema nucula TaxID=690887 RepID=A0A6A5YVS6_9PLEO|nr:Alpha/beta hydrolase family-domain-containing protein [Lophiotrema nucula]